MKIVIAGAGDVGSHLARLMCFENQEITLIDSDQEVLDFASSSLDVLTIRGDSTSLATLMDASVQKSRLFIAATTSEKTNLVSAILAKKLGAKQTIARIENPEYLMDDNKEFFHELGVDHMISPRLLAAKEIERLLNRSSFTDIFEFEKGKINVIGTTLDEHSSLVNRSIGDVHKSLNNITFRPFALLRGDQTIIPTSSTVLQNNDHVYLMATREELEAISKLIEREHKKIKKLMIIGGTPLALKTAQRLEKTFKITLVCADKERCKYFVELLEDVLVIEGDPSNNELLKEENIEDMDAFLALTENSETNIIASLMAEQSGVYKTVAHVNNADYTRISQYIGIDTLINEKIIAANNIFRFIRKGKIEAIATLHGVEAELIEFTVHRENQLTRKPLKSLPIPSGAKVAAVVRGADSIIPDPDFTLQVEDKVIVFATPQYISTVEKLFN